MATVSYAVYDMDTGEVLHVHSEPAELDSTPEEIIKLAGPRPDRRLSVLRIPREEMQGLPGLSVIVKDGAFQAAEGHAAFGGAEVDDDDWEPTAERRYER